MKFKRAAQYCVLSLVALSACQEGAHFGRTKGRLIADGSSSVYPLVNAAAVAFKKANPDVTFQIEKSGSGVGIKRITEKGDVAFVNSSRAVKTSELDAAEKHGRHLHSTTVAAEAIAIVVNPQNHLSDVSLRQLKDVFFDGKLDDWSALPESGLSGPIQVAAIDPKVSGTGEFFVEHVGGKTQPPYAISSKVVPDNQFVPEAVMGSPNAIGFCSQSTARGTKLRLLKVEGVVPSEQTVLDTSYPISRRLFVVTDGQPRGATAEFVLYLLSAPGQELARQQGFTPVTLEVSL